MLFSLYFRLSLILNLQLSQGPYLPLVNARNSLCNLFWRGPQFRFCRMSIGSSVFYFCLKIFSWFFTKEYSVQSIYEDHHLVFFFCFSLFLILFINLCDWIIFSWKLLFDVICFSLYYLPIQISSQMGKLQSHAQTSH